MSAKYGEKDYSMILLNSITRLDGCKKMSGSEGIVYLLNDKFVVKKYLVIGDWDLFDKVFNDFCREMQDVSQTTGYAKIYAWTKLPNMRFYTGKDKNKYVYYILEERVKGRDLYYGFLEDSYELSKDLCSQRDYYYALKQPEDCFLLFKKIIEYYIKDYIEINEYLESLDEQKLAKLIQDFFTVDETSKYFVSDIHPTNILIENGNLRPIDPMVAYNGKIFKTSDEIKDALVNKVILLFWANEMCLDKSLAAYFRQDKSLLCGEFTDLQEQNKKVCKAVLLKFIKIMNKYLDNPSLFDKKMFKESHVILNDIFAGDEASIKEVENELNFSF